MAVTKRSVIAAGAALAVAGTAHAQSSVTLYGIIDAGLTYTTNQKGGQTWLEMSGITQGSRWGLRGNEDLGAGLYAVFVLENGFSIANGTLGQGGLMFGRQAYVGLSSDRLGALTLGRQYEEMVEQISPVTTDQWGVLFEHPGDNDNTNRGFRVNNTIKYVSPTFSGAQFTALYAPGGQPGSIATNSVYSFGAHYSAGGLYAGAAFTHVDHPGALAAGTFWTTANSVNGSYAIAARAYQVFGVGASYQFGSAKVGGAFTQSTFKGGFGGQDVRFQNYEVNASYRFTPAALLGVAFVYTDGRVDVSDSRPRYEQADLFFDYSLSKRTDVYLMGTGQHAIGSAKFAQVSQFLSASTTSEQAAIAVGMRHRF
ncbi:porin [Paraburkholderia guartelaensis]|uniref:porin n=1 Tax=Paraburkholderia guartelaensis TaxID=2546446 RepID=UPI002AB5EB64|nr:porin [Paraburkholderia guartelaensis]